jgi:plastocyanin
MKPESASDKGAFPGRYDWSGAARAQSGAFVLAAVLVAGCGGGDTPTETRPPTPLDLSTVGAIRVTVSFAGLVPPAAAVNMASTPACAAAHPEGVRDASLQVEAGRVANAVVWIKDGLGDRVFAIPTAAVTIDQKGCLYDPHVSVARVGQPITFVNSDREPHNVHARPAFAASWNFLMSRPSSTRTITIDRAEVAIPIGCDIHPWMRAWAATFVHPYFAVTVADGTATLAQVPPGDYVVGVWHERLGTLESRASLAARGTADMGFAYLGR